MNLWRHMYYFMAMKLRVKHIVFSTLLVLLLAYFGAFTHIFEENYFDYFDNYPLEGDITHYVDQLKRNLKPSVDPINEYKYSFLSSCETKCVLPADEKLRLVYIVKSATLHFDRRQAIRQSWGYEKRFSDVNIRTVFILGTNGDSDGEIQKKIELEKMSYRDIVQADFEDTYFNNTIKTMIGFKWAVQHCPNSKFYMFSDDDMYVSTKNVLSFIRNPTQYPEYMIDHIAARNAESNRKKDIVNNNFTGTQKTQKKRIDPFLDLELPEDVKLLTGYVFFSAPHRHRSSKWHVTLSEYPYHMWPPYVTAGAYIVSHSVLFDLYYASFFSKHFRFDDIYVGILAKKMGIEPYHCNEFYFYKKEFKVYQYRYVIASHGYDNPHELLSVWNQMRSAGYA